MTEKRTKPRGDMHGAEIGLACCALPGAQKKARPYGQAAMRYLNK